ncbi:MAG: low affinity iron permease family protein [Deltaproteobacteria bacterium]|nr:low affinity iron permease family protein [Deltaproteobacteria bacterium]
MHEFFRRIARQLSNAVGSPYAFVFAVVGVLAWLLSGPIFGFSDTWQLVINTTTTIITFLMVFMIQNTQTHDTRAIHLKLDELLHAVKAARNELIDLEDLPDSKLTQLESEFSKLRTKLEKTRLPRATDS